VRGTRRIPDGFTEVGAIGCRAILRDDWAAALAEEGLTTPWRLPLERVAHGATGRGPRAVIRLGDGRVVLVKQCLRGGWLARVNRARYASARRFLRELDVGRRATAAGCPVLPAVGVVLRRGRPGVEAWSMSPYLEGAEDLSLEMQKLADPADRERRLEQALAELEVLYRLGLHHRDLNLGNVLVASQAEGHEPLIRVIDLDRARWIGRPLSRRVGRRVTARFERSWRKVLGADGGVPARRRGELYQRFLGDWVPTPIQP
jgi:hypothetical protein